MVVKVLGNVRIPAPLVRSAGSQPGQPVPPYAGQSQNATLETLVPDQQVIAAMAQQVPPVIVFKVAAIACYFLNSSLKMASDASHDGRVVLSTLANHILQTLEGMDAGKYRISLKETTTYGGFGVEFFGGVKAALAAPNESAAVASFVERVRQHPIAQALTAAERDTLQATINEAISNKKINLAMSETDMVKLISSL